MRLPRRPIGVPLDLRGLPNRAATTVMRPWDWALPPRSFDLEIISAMPDGWQDAPRGSRRPPLLFVHGACGAAWNFTEHWLGAAIRRGYPAHAVSLRGHGGSAGRERLHTTVLRDYLDDMMQTIITLPEPPVLVGHGMGAVVVQQVLQRYPARAAVLVAPTPVFGVQGNTWSQVTAPVGGSLRSLLSGRLPLRPDLMFDGLDEQTATAYLRRMDRESPLVMLQLGMTHRIGPIYSPIAVVGARADAVVQPADVRHTADMYGVKPIWLPGAGHLVMLDSSHSVGLDIILDWVDGLATGAPAVDAVSARR